MKAPSDRPTDGPAPRQRRHGSRAGAGVRAARGRRDPVDECADADAITAMLDEDQAGLRGRRVAGRVTAVLIAAAETRRRSRCSRPRAPPGSAPTARGCASWPPTSSGLPTVPFWFAGSAEELGAVAEHAGFPLVVTPRRGARPADGQSVLTRPDDVEAAWQLRDRGSAGRRRTRDGRDRRRGRRRGHAADRAHHRAVGADGALLRADRPPHGADGGHRWRRGSRSSCRPPRWTPRARSPPASSTRSAAAACSRVELLVRGDEVYFSTVRRAARRGRAW